MGALDDPARGHAFARVVDGGDDAAGPTRDPASAQASVPRKDRSSRGAFLLRIALLAVLPIGAIAELVAGEVQHGRVPVPSQWSMAASAAIAAKQPGDVILVAPRWAEQHGRMALAGGVPLLTPAPGAGPAWAPQDIDRFFDVHVAARPDLETARRVLELSIRGKDDPQTRGWRLVSTQAFGDVSLRTLENPHPQRLVRDLSDEIDTRAKVARISPDGTIDACRWEVSGAQHIPNLTAGPVPPVDRWLCSPWDANWTFVAPTVITDLEYAPRRCILMHPIGTQVTTIELPPGPIGHRFVGYVGLHVYVERELVGAPVLARVSIAGKEIAKARHVDGDGWLRFEGSTEEFAGTSQPVKLELWAENGDAKLRLACMSAQLRDDGP